MGAKSNFEKFWAAVVYGSTWAVGGIGEQRVPYAVHLYKSTISKAAAGALTRDDIHEAVFAPGFRGSRKVATERFIYFFAQVLAKYNVDEILRHPVRYQGLIIKEAEQVGYVGHWTAAVPFKILIIAGLVDPAYADPKRGSVIEPPAGSNVVKAIEFLTGYRGTSKEVVMAIHRRLAELANTDIITINSGLWKLGNELPRPA